MVSDEDESNDNEDDEGGQLTNGDASAYSDDDVAPNTTATAELELEVEYGGTFFDRLFSVSWFFIDF